jgi:colanic acid/amylovoran biosynthesis protein
MKILITNPVVLNPGDAAILEAMHELLQDVFGKDTSLLTYDTHSEVAARYYPHLRFHPTIFAQAVRSIRTGPFRSRRRRFALARAKLAAWCLAGGQGPLARVIAGSAVYAALTEYASADLILSAGGTYLVETYSLEPRLFDFELALLMGKPLVLFTQSLGPFRRLDSRTRLARIFEQAALILVRDEASRRNIEELGVRSRRIQIAADVAFALADPERIARAKRQPDARMPVRSVAISVRFWQHFRHLDADAGMNGYRRAIRAVTVHLVRKHNAHVTFLSTCQGIPEYWTDDSRTADEIVQSLPLDVAGAVAVDRAFHTPLMLRELVSEFDLVIATRLHMAILALGVGTPVLPIAYEFKTTELFTRLGCADWVSSIDDLTPDALIEKVDAFLEALPALREPVFRAVERERHSALNSAGLVRAAWQEWTADRAIAVRGLAVSSVVKGSAR